MCGKLQVLNLPNFRIILCFKWTGGAHWQCQHIGGRTMDETLEGVGRLVSARRLRKLPILYRGRALHVSWLWEERRSVCACAHAYLCVGEQDCLDGTFL